MENTNIAEISFLTIEDLKEKFPFSPFIRPIINGIKDGKLDITFMIGLFSQLDTMLINTISARFNYTFIDDDEEWRNAPTIINILMSRMMNNNDKMLDKYLSNMARVLQEEQYKINITKFIDPKTGEIKIKEKEKLLCTIINNINKYSDEIYKVMSDSFELEEDEFYMTLYICIQRIEKYNLHIDNVHKETGFSFYSDFTSARYYYIDKN